MSSNELLLFAQHQDDQAETLLLQLLRGAGPKGLASMAVISDFGQGKLYRPFLNVEQKVLAEYAKLNKLQWVEDDSNHNTKFDRNYLRHQVIPQIKQRWPSMATTLSRSARLCAQAAHLESRLGEKLLPEVLGDAAHIINIDRLRQYETHEQTLIIRHWVAESGRQMPNEKHIQQLFGKVINARTDATPELTWQAGEIRRYKRHLYLMSPITQPRINLHYQWTPTRPLPLPCIGKQLDSKYVLGEGLDAKRCERGFEVLFRSNSEQCIGKNGCLQSLKKILQNLDIPPWERYRLPLLINAGHVIAVGGYWVSPEYQAQKDQWGYKLILS